MFYDAFNTLHWYYNIKSITNVTSMTVSFTRILQLILAMAVTCKHGT